MQKSIITGLILLSLTGLWFVETKTAKPTYAKIYTQKGQEWLKNGNPVKAEKDFLTALHHNPHERTANYQLGMIYKAHGDFQKALSHFSKVITIGPDYEKLYLDLQSSNVIKDYDYAAANYEIGLDALNKGDLKKAIIYLYRSIYFNQASSFAHYYLGLAYLKNNQLGKAKQQAFNLNYWQMYPAARKLSKDIQDFKNKN